MPEYGLFPVVGSFPAVNLETSGAWETDGDSYLELYSAIPQIGDNRHRPGIDGRLPVPHEGDELVVGIPLLVLGEKDAAGVAHADARVGVRQNLRYLNTNLFTPPGTTDGTRPFEFHELGGDVYEADVQVFQGTLGRVSPVAVRLTVRIKIPAGVLELVP